VTAFDSSIPGIRGRVVVNFPAQVQGTDGMSVSKAGGVYTIRPDTGALATIASISGTVTSVLYTTLWNSATGTYRAASLDAFYAAQPLVNLSTSITGTLAVGNGGSGAISFTAFGVLYGNSTSPISATIAMSDGQLLVGATGGAPVPKTVAGDITLSVAGTATIAGNAVTNNKLATATPYSFKANTSSATATISDVTIAGLTHKASPTGADKLLVSDTASSGSFAYSTITEALGAVTSGVASLNGLSGTVTLVPVPSCRISLTSASAVMASTISSATAIWLHPYNGGYVPVYDGTRLVPLAISTPTSCTMTSTTASMGYHQAARNFDVFALNPSGSLIIGTGPQWQSGTVAGSDTARGTGANSGALTPINGIQTNSATMTIRFGSAASSTLTVGPNMATYLGTIRTTVAGQSDWIFGAAATSGTAAFFGVWNAYNRVLVDTSVQDTTASWSYNSATVRAANGSSSSRVSFVAGLSEDGLSAVYQTRVSAGGGSDAAAGIALNATNTFNGLAGYSNTISNLSIFGTLEITTPLGFNFLQATESNPTATSASFFTGAAGGFQFTGLNVKLRM
jgi:hypothetical protein